MVDLAVISAALSALKTLTSWAKEKKDPELTQQIIELQSLILQLQENLTQLQTENAELRQALELRDGLIYEESVYWRTVNDKRDGPFCPGCADRDGKLVRLQPGANPGYFSCGLHGCFETDEYRDFLKALKGGS